MKNTALSYDSFLRTLRSPLIKERTIQTDSMSKFLLPRLVHNIQYMRITHTYTIIVTKIMSTTHLKYL